MEMETLTEVVQSTKQIKIQGFSVTSAMSNGEFFKSRTRWTVGDYDWEVLVVPRLSNGSRDYVALNLRFHSEAPTDNNVKANFSCRFIDPSGKLKPSQGSSGTYKFTRGSYTFNLMARADLQTSGYIKDDAFSFTVECTIMMLRELAESAVTHPPEGELVPSSGLHNDLGELLRKGTGSDVTLVVSGEFFRAQKAILASRSPVFMSEFFGHMKEKRSQLVEIKGMEVDVFRAMLHFIYTDSAPELDWLEDGMAIAQHLLVAADRYWIDGLKLICEDKLDDGINIDTAATILALAEQHGCSRLKAKCVELIAANLEVVMATEGYNHLVATCPSVLNDLLKVVHGRKN